MKITELKIEGFRSLRNVSWLPGKLNVIIGANGTGKSNLLRLLELISMSAQGKLGKHIQTLGGMDPILWDGFATSIKILIPVIVILKIILILPWLLHSVMILKSWFSLIPRKQGSHTKKLLMEYQIRSKCSI